MSYKTLTQAERIAGLEVQVQTLSEDVKAMNRKIDELLALKNKGAGAFWLVSIVVGSGLVGLVGLLVNWLKS